MFKKIISWFSSSHQANEPIYRSREIWSYTHFDPKTRGASGRPVLIYRKASDGMFWGLPLTNVGRNGKTLYVPRLKNGKKVSALSQMRTLQAGRLVRRLGKAGEKEFSALSTAIVRLLAETTPVQAPVVRKVYKRPMPVRAHFQRAVPSPFSPVYILQPR